MSIGQLEAIHGVLPLGPEPAEGLGALHAHGLPLGHELWAEWLKGHKLGIDSRVIEANASLRGLEHRNTEESYWEYVKRLGAEAGVDPCDTKAVRRFDKKREGRKTSNQEWQNPPRRRRGIGRPEGGRATTPGEGGSHQGWRHGHD